MHSRGQRRLFFVKIATCLGWRIFEKSNAIGLEKCKILGSKLLHKNKAGMISKYSETTIYAYRLAAKAIFCEKCNLFGLKNFRKKQGYRLRKMSDSGVKIVS